MARPTNCPECTEPLRDCLCQVDAPTRLYLFVCIDGEEDWSWCETPDELAEAVANFLSEYDAFGWHEYPNTYALTCCAPEQPDYDDDDEWWLHEEFHAGTVTPILGNIPDHWLAPKA